MTIECYRKYCQYHEYQRHGPESGPFCDDDMCHADERGIIPVSPDIWGLLNVAALSKGSDAREHLISAMGPDAVEDWFDGGEDRWVKEISSLIQEGDIGGLGHFFYEQARRYLEDVVSNAD